MQKETMFAQVVSLLLIAAAGAVEAAEQPGAAARAKVVAPFIEEETIGFAYADLSRVDVNALVDKVVEMIPGAREEQQAAKVGMAAVLTAFRAAGGKDVYGVLSLADIGFSGATPFLIVPIHEGANEAALKVLLKQSGAETVERVGDVLFVGAQDTLERLQSGQPDRRPELVTALRATGGAMAQALLLPTADNRRVIEEMLPELPEVIGGGSSRVITRGILWAVVGVDPPPQMSLKLVIRSEDGEAAVALRNKWIDVWRIAGRQEKVREMVPTFDQIAELLTPEAQADRLVLSLDEQNRGIATLVTLLNVPLQRARQAARRAASANNLKQIALAMQSHVSVKKRFPAAAIYSEDGKPLLSWRVWILPYLGQKKLYDQFRLDEAWDSQHNRKLIEKMPAVYRSPASKLKQKGRASYLAVVGEGTVFPGREGVQFQDIKDGPSRTVLVVEVGDQQAIVWTKPGDLQFDPEQPAKGLGGLYEGGFQAAFCDGSVHFLSLPQDPDNLRGLFTRDGGETVSVK